MKLFSAALYRKRKVILFIAAFLLPLVFVVVAGIDTFSKRQKATRNLLESNLWFSGKSALEQIEQQFIELEQQILNESNFHDLRVVNNSSRKITEPGLFALNADCQIILPRTAKENNTAIEKLVQHSNSNFSEYITKAETAELIHVDYSGAASFYERSIAAAQNTRQKALAVQGLARSFLAAKKYEKAIQYYQLLKNDYNQIKNDAGHPYGITTPLQLRAIEKLYGRRIISNDTLFQIYQQMNNGNWLITSPSYFFFKSEYEAVINIQLGTEITPYEEMLDYSRFVENFAIPAVKERTEFENHYISREIKRNFLVADGTPFLISFKEIPDSTTNQPYFAGVCWNLDTLKTRFIPEIITQLVNETELDFKLVNYEGMNILTETPAQIPKESLSLSFSSVPFPWTLVAIQPGFKKLESDAKIQAIIYGALVVIIITLMLFAVFAILREMRRETDSMLLQTEFVHNVSHELKTPLSLIRLYGETLLLKENLPEPDRKEGLQIITKESERLSYMINNILDFSKIEMGRKEFDIKPGNLSETVKNTLNSFRYNLLRKGFAIETDIDENLPEIPFDKSAVEGILINLFSNAIKFSDEIKRLKVRLKKQPAKICLEVTDSGIGIPPDELPHIFNRFYRVKRTAGFNAKGSGLGLTLVKHATEAHQWQIEVKSEPGKGTSFNIHISIKKQEASR